MKRENSKLISEVIKDYIKEDHLEDGLLKVRIYEAWDLLLASMLPGKPYQEIHRLTTNRFYKDRTLTCGMASSVIRSQLQFIAGSLPDRLNSLLQGSYIDKVVLR